MDSAAQEKKSRPYVPRVNNGGNYCGHSPDAPRLDLVKPVTAAEKQLPGILQVLLERMKRYFSAPHRLPSLCHANGKKRQQRSERREACTVLMAAILSRTDLASLRCGVPTKDGFVSLTLDFLVNYTGLHPRRAERALADLKRANLVTVSQPRQMQADGSWKGLAAIKAVNKLLFAAFGLARRLQHERKRASARLAKKVKKAGGNLTGWARNALVLGGLLDSGTRRKTESKPTPQGDDQLELQKARTELYIALMTEYPDKTPAEIREEAERIISSKTRHRA